MPARIEPLHPSESGVSIPFDTLAFVKTMRSVGFTQEQAEVQVDFFVHIFTRVACAKQDLAELKIRLTTVIAEANSKQAITLEKITSEQKAAIENVVSDQKRASMRSKKLPNSSRNLKHACCSRWKSSGANPNRLPLKCRMRLNWPLRKTRTLGN